MIGKNKDIEKDEAGMNGVHVVELENGLRHETGSMEWDGMEGERHADER